jgi:hypothetical protein
METVLAFGVVLTLLPMAWYFIRWIVSSADRKRGFRNRLLASIALFVLLLIGFGNVLDSRETRIAQELGFENVGEYREAKKINIGTGAAWRDHKDAIKAERAALRAEEEERRKADAEAAAQLAQKEEEARLLKEAENAAAKRAEEERCKTDLQCWGEKAWIRGGSRCSDLIERMAKHDFEWTDGVFETKFSHFRWRDVEAGIVTIIGDKIKMQNGFGAWTHMTYECDFNPATETVSDVRVREGRI